MADFKNAIKSDYKIFDHVESVTLTTKPAGAATSLTYVSRETLTVDEVLSSDGFFGFNDAAFWLPGEQIAAGNEPKAADTITTSTGVVWEILRAVLDEFETNWRCVSRKAR